VKSAVIALSAEAQLHRQAEIDQQDAATIEAGRKVIASEENCAGCHKFREAGELGSAPDLTGYGSRKWLVGMISNPTHERFYADRNDRMPAFAEHGADTTNNMLTQKQLGLIVDWLRGDWYEPPVAEASGAKAEPAKESAAE
jgi:ubiquinol-cytochrome c reductase cytochrome b subunit